MLDETGTCTNKYNIDGKFVTSYDLCMMSALYNVMMGKNGTGQNCDKFYFNYISGLTIPQFGKSLCDILGIPSLYYNH